LSHNTNSKKRKSTADEDKGSKKHQKLVSSHSNLACTLITVRLDEHKDSFADYKDFARWIIRSEHLFVSWYTVLDVGLKADAEDYDVNDRYVSCHQYIYLTHPFIPGSWNDTGSNWTFTGDYTRNTHDSQRISRK
jgi:hypothetical protein